MTTTNEQDSTNGMNQLSPKLFGGPLPPGEAGKQKAEFERQIKPTPDKYPQAVCYSINELIFFLTSAKVKLALDGIADDQQGVALMLGINKDTTAGHAQDMVTVMLVATAFTEDNNRQVTKISNPLLCKNDLGEVTENAYDAGSLWP